MIEIIISLIPIFIAIGSFIKLHRTWLALMLGSVSAAIICTNFNFSQTVILLSKSFLGITHLDHLSSWTKFLESDRLPLLLFIVCINLFISLIHKSGIVYGYYNFLSSKLTGKISAEISCLGLGMLLFIDDYLNVMTNGRVSSMLCHKFKVPRIKIGFLVTCLAAPLCSLIPISSWAANIISIISSATEKTSFKEQESFFLLVQATPFMFYSLILIASAFFIVFAQISFGKIKQAELKVESTTSTIIDPIPDHVWKFNIFHFVIPVVGLLLIIITSMLFFGGYLSSTNSMIAALRSNESPGKSLLAGTLITVLSMIIFLLPNKLLRPSQLLEVLKEGLLESKDILTLIIVSNVFGKLISNLGTGHLLAKACLSLISIQTLSTSFFLVSAIVAFFLGSSWAAMAIIFPTTLPMLDSLIFQMPPASIHTLLVTCIGAILSGIIFGSSFSPASDLLLMTSKSCKISLDDYLRVQMEYLPIIATGPIVSFLISGYLINTNIGLNWLISISCGLVTTCSLLYLRKIFSIANSENK